MGRRKSELRYSPGRGAAALGAALLDWYGASRRDLPWRRSRDPYRIWVSEVMLQQTRVETVIPYYQRWLERFPDLESLAAASEEEVLKLWEGLGYYSRARNLHGAVREVVQHYGGEVPDSAEAIAGLKGVGPYTAGAILSIAFNRAVPALDGNVMRVLSRLFLIGDDTARPATRQAMEHLARELIPPGQASAFNQALMELGALVCVPGRPRCGECPLAEFCRGLNSGVAAELPVKSKGRPPRAVDVVVGVIRQGGRLLMVRRPEQGLLGGLWEFPGGEVPAGLSWEQGLHRLILDRLGMELVVEAQLIGLRHTFTHLQWNLRAYTAGPALASPLPVERTDLLWVLPEELRRLPLPVAHQKVMRAVEAAEGRTGLPPTDH